MMLMKIEKAKVKIAIVDEAHKLKNIQSNITQIIVPFLQKLKHVILLTGTPIFARPKEVFPLLQIIRPDIFHSFKTFGERYCDPKQSKFGLGKDYQGSSNDKELHFILKKTIMIRRLKTEVLTQLPQKHIKKIIVDTDPKIMAAMHSVINNINKISVQSLYNSTNGQPGSQPEHDRALANCYQLSGLAKLKGVKNYIRELLEDDIKIIVFAQHIEILNHLEDFVNTNQKKKSIRIDGNVNEKDRFDRVQIFQNDPSVRVAILSLTAACVGFTLTASSNIIFAEMSWTPAIMQQAEDRAHRIGQLKNVICHYIVGEGTLDDNLFKKIQQKISVVSKILDGQQKQFRMNEIRNAQGQIIHNDQQSETFCSDYIENIDVQQNNELFVDKNNNHNNQVQLNLNYHNDFQSEHSHCTEGTQLGDKTIQKDIKSIVNIINQLQSSDSESDDEEEIFILKMKAQQSSIKKNNLKCGENNSFILDTNIDKSPLEKNLIQETLFSKFDDSFNDIIVSHLPNETNPQLQLQNDDYTQNNSLQSLNEVPIEGNILPNASNCNNSLYNNNNTMNSIDNKDDSNSQNKTNYSIESIKNEPKISQPYSINTEQNNLTCNNNLNINTLPTESTKDVYEAINSQINLKSDDSFNLSQNENELILPRSDQNSFYNNDCKKEDPVDNIHQNQVISLGLQTNNKQNNIFQNNSQDGQCEREEIYDISSTSSLQSICTSQKIIEKQDNAMQEINFQSENIIFISDCDQDDMSDDKYSEPDISITITIDLLSSTKKSDNNILDLLPSKSVSAKKRDFFYDHSELQQETKETSLKKLKKTC